MSRIFEKLIEGVRNTLKKHYDKDGIDSICATMIKDIEDPNFRDDPVLKGYAPSSVTDIWLELPKETKLAVYIMTRVSLARDSVRDLEQNPKKKPISRGSKVSSQIH